MTMMASSCQWRLFKTYTGYIPLGRRLLGRSSQNRGLLGRSSLGRISLGRSVAKKEIYFRKTERKF